MRQDRRLNGWVLLGSIIQIISSIIAIVAGAGLAVVGFLYQDKLAKLTDLQVFMGHLSALQDELLNKHLLTKYLYLVLGVSVAVIGLIALIFAIVTLVYARKRKVVRHRFASLIFSLIPLAIAGCVATYLILEMKEFTDNMKYVAYGIIGAFGISGLFIILGVMFGRSEKFMSNDNGKYAFDNSSLRNARAGANNNVKTAQMQYPAQVNQGQYVPLNQAQQPMQAQRPMQPQANPMRPNQSGMPQRNAMQARPNMPNQARPMQPAQPRVPMGQATARPVQPMQRPAQPMQRPMARPAQPAQPQARAQRFCNKCGKLLNPNEVVCSLCGTKIIK